MVEKQKCQHKREDGTICKAYALSDSELCLAHDRRPKIAKIREEASKTAGLSQKILFPEVIEGKLPEIVRPINIKRARDIKKAIVRTLQEIRFGKLDIEIGRTLLYGFNTLVHCIKEVDLLQRVEALEKALKLKEFEKGNIEERIKRLEELLNLTKKERRELTPEEKQRFEENAHFLAKQDGIETEEEFKIWLRIWIAKAKRGEIGH